MKDKPAIGYVSCHMSSVWWCSYHYKSFVSECKKLERVIELALATELGWQCGWISLQLSNTTVLFKVGFFYVGFTQCLYRQNVIYITLKVCCCQSNNSPFCCLFYCCSQFRCSVIHRQV